MNKTALITGASGGIGEEIAKQMAAKGYNLVLIARTQSKLESLASDLMSQHKIRAISIASDLSSPAATQEILKELEAQKLTIDVLINNAAFGDYGEFASSDPSKIEPMINLNILSLTTVDQSPVATDVGS